MQECEWCDSWQKAADGQRTALIEAGRFVADGADCFHQSGRTAAAFAHGALGQQPRTFGKRIADTRFLPRAFEYRQTDPKEARCREEGERGCIHGAHLDAFDKKTETIGLRKVSA